jgi:hypothetical protein
MVAAPSLARAANAARYRAAAALAGVAAADIAFDPEHHHVPLCPLHATTGVWCPLCGGLRAGYAVVHGQFGAAARANLLVVAAVPLVALWWLDAVGRARAGRPARALSRRAWWVAGAVAVLFTVVRNVPGADLLHPAS